MTHELLNNRKTTINEFHKLFNLNRQVPALWLGIKIQKSPFDLFIYQEIMYECRPDILIECGTRRGGSALFFASIFDLIGNGHVLTIENNACDDLPNHSRITYINGDSVSDDVLNKISTFLTLCKTGKIMVSLDSNHSKDHVLKELKIYSPLVTVGQYLVCEDGCVNGNPIYPDHGPGPAEAIEEFMKSNDNFIIDKQREKFLMTYHPNGFLRKMK